MKPIVIAGNGPSLAQIDYSRLPQDFDVFRCNQFYFEDKYFLGKKIKGVFFNPSVLREQIFTLHHLKERGEYEVEDVYCQRGDDSELVIEGNKVENIFPSVKSTYDFLKKLPLFNELDKFHRFFFHQWPTAGIVMLYTAIAQGYKEIYLTGIDFYGGGGTDYAFKIDPKSNIATRIPAFRDSVFQAKVHTQSLDIAFIQLALTLPDIKLYAVSPNSALSEILPLSPVQNHQVFEVESKPKGYICDWIKPPRSLSPFKQKLKDYGINGKNIYVKAVMDLIQLCKAIVYALRN